MLSTRITTSRNTNRIEDRCDGTESSYLDKPIIGLKHGNNELAHNTPKETSRAASLPLIVDACSSNFVSAINSKPAKD